MKFFFLLLITSSVFADVRFSDPRNETLKAIFPAMDPQGVIPAEVPPGATPNPARITDKECAKGFKIAEDITKSWKYGKSTYTLSAFFTTTWSPKGSCYSPQPWVCVLADKKVEGCAQVEQEITFPNNPSFDTANFKMSAEEKAFGLRLYYETGNASEITAPTALVLFRLKDKKLSQILAVEISRQETVYDDKGETECKSAFVLDAMKNQTQGFFDWQVIVDKKNKTKPCQMENNPVGTYKWNGTKYIK